MSLLASGLNCCPSYSSVLRALRPRIDGSAIHYYFSTRHLSTQVAMDLFSSLTDSLGNVLREHFGTLQKIFLAGLNDTDLPTQVASLRSGARPVREGITEEK